MVGLSTSITFTSIISALLYGSFLSLFIELIALFYYLVSFLISCIKNKKRASKTDIIYGDIASLKKKPIAITMTAILLFGLAFTFFSYATLDGNLRLYPFLIMLVSYKASETFVFTKAENIFLRFTFRAGLYLEKIIIKASTRIKNTAHLIKNGKNDHKSPLTK